MKKSYFAALVQAANTVSIPILASIITILIYVTFSTPGWFSNLVGGSDSEWVIVPASLLLTILIWLLLAWLFMYFTAFENANPQSASALNSMSRDLKEQLDIVDRNLDLEYTSKSKSIPEYQELARQKAETAIKELKDILGSKGLLWASADGYINAWNLVHTAENEMVMLLPKEEVIRNAEYDQSRLQGSTIPDSDGKLKRIQKALDTLSTPGTDNNKSVSANASSALQTSLAKAMLALLKHTIDPPKLTPKQQDLLAQDPDGQKVLLTQDADIQHNTSQAMLDLMKNVIDSPVQPSQQSEIDARIDLSQIRSDINQYSDDRWARLVNNRKIMMVTAALTGIFTYVLLVVSVLLHATVPGLIAATVFYIVGVAIGLFSRLYSEWSDNNTTVDDYGLVIGRVLVTPVLSGLAAVGGILMVSLLSLTLLSSPGSGGNSTSSGNATATATPAVVSTVATSGVTVQVSITQQPAPVSNNQSLPTLGKIFNLETNLTALVFAAVFGFTPSLFINLLQAQANNWQSQIQSNSQANQSSGSSSGGSKGKSSGGSSSN
jgi:hypothetical protein